MVWLAIYVILAPFYVIPALLYVIPAKAGIQNLGVIFYSLSTPFKLYCQLRCHLLDPHLHGDDIKGFIYRI